MRPRWLLEASGVALLLSLPYFAQLLFPGDISLYHHHRHLAHILCGLLLAMLEIAVLAFCALTYFEHRFFSTPRAILGASLAALIVLRAADGIIDLTFQLNTSLNPTFYEGAPPSTALSTFTHVWWQWPVRIGIMIFIGILAWKKPSITRRFVRVIRFALAGFALSLIWIVPELIYFSYGLKPSASPQIAPAHAVTTTTDKRIVWILFDELSYNLVFDHTPAAMEFPNLNKLHSQSVSFSDVQPLGFYTDRIIPSLIAGRQIEEMHSNLDRNLLYLNQTEGQWVTYDPNQTLFAVAKSNGWSSGIVGWHNPYCRLLRSVLTFCAWEPGEVSSLPLEVIGASEDKSALANSSILARAFLLARSPSATERLAPRARVYSSLMTKTEKLIQDEKINFVFIHLSVPHPPGFYDRKTHQLCICGNYLDNLVLADDTLGQLLKEVNRSRGTDQTTIIISSDHSWRVPLWRGWLFWTPEEERISQGRFDTRPVFLVHFPGQQSAIDITAPQPELIEHDIIASMLQNKLQSPDDLMSFLHNSRPAQ